MKWAAAAGGGKVLQVIQGTDTTVTTITSTTYVTTGLSATITPAANSSKVLILISNPHFSYRETTRSAEPFFAIYNGSSNIVEGFVGMGLEIQTSATETQVSGYGEGSYAYLDSPNTTSARTYTLYAKVADNANAGQINCPTSGATATMILMEIGA